MITEGVSKNKWNNVFVFGNDGIHGMYGYIEEVDYSKPAPYCIVRDGEMGGLWWRREDFKYVEPQLSMKAAFKQIEEIANRNGSIDEIKDVFNHYRNTSDRP